MLIKILGVDPALNNLGLAHMVYNTQTTCLDLERVDLIVTDNQAGKTVRKNSDDLRRARELYGALLLAQHEKHCVVAEVPTGTQSARGSISNGICIGVLACLSKPLIEVSPSEVKMASVGSKSASKQEMIDWGTRQYPHANWPMRGGNYLKKNEHLADAVAAVWAGVRTEQFKGMVSMMEAMTV